MFGFEYSVMMVRWSCEKLKRFYFRVEHLTNSVVALKRIVTSKTGQPSNFQSHPFQKSFR
jgi:hypothetical protein